MVSEPRHYQAANVFFTADLSPAGATTVDFVVFELAATNHLLMSTVPTTNVIQGAAKGVEIGGFVYKTKSLAYVVGAGATPRTMKIWWDLYWDRHDEIGNPCYNPTNVDKTQAIVSAAPVVSDTDFPVRWVRRDFDEIYCSALSTTALQFVRNVKIRRRIGDRESLCLAFAARSDANGNGLDTLRCTVAGTLYYRVIF